MSKSMFFFLMLFLSGQVYAVSERLSEPHQIGITLKNRQPCFYLHGEIPIGIILIYSHHPYHSKNKTNVYLGGYDSEEKRTGYNMNSCINVEEVSVGLDIPYNVHVREKDRNSPVFSHDELFCMRKKGSRLYIAEVENSTDGKTWVCTDREMTVKYRPRQPEAETGFWEKIRRWFRNN